MRRLFSTFASGLPGAALFIMRLVAGTALTYSLVAAWSPAPGPAFVLVFRAGLGMLLVAGLPTPIAGALLTIIELVSLYLRFGDIWLHVLLSTLGLALTLLGPGTWSVDAWLFGWKRIEIQDRPCNSPRGLSSSF